MFPEARANTAPADPGPHGSRTVRRPRRGADEAGKVLVLVNAILIGVPSAYLASGSLAVTALAVTTACLTVLFYLRLGRHAA
ncbi:hypothetical protein PVK74_30490 [Micromonospora chalcea]|uniref:hypothetical protein n=1 Tax=Micromonospora chalcea TaxID=1874 RepID=UPI0023795005|nr:hypothetical protein [Micromonospora chalcea]WDQ00101.1 hypothetical protein PVK74_30490 [Micromonospora chalcea]